MLLRNNDWEGDNSKIGLYLNKDNSMRIIVSFLVLFIWANVDVFAQQVAEPEKIDSADVEEAVFEIIEKLASFSGGMTEMLKFISANLIYPEIAQENGIEGTVILEFIVEKDGSLSNIKCIKDIGGGCCDAAVNVAKLMPNWIPGTQRGQPVRTKMKIPVKFKLPKVAEEEPAFQIVEQMPEYPGGTSAMMKFISTNIVYPDIAIKNGIEGTVIIEYIVEKDGSISNIRIIKDIGGGCGDAAINVIKLMPKWKPGSQADKIVRVKMLAPIKFRLSKK